MGNITTIKCPNCKSLVPIGYAICPYCGYDLRFIVRFHATKQITIRDIYLRLKKSLKNPLSVYTEVALAPDTRGPLILLLIMALVLSIRLNSVISYTVPSILLNAGLISSFLYFTSILLINLTLSFVFSFLYIILVNFFLSLIGAEATFSQSFAIYGYSLWPSIVMLIISDLFLPFILPSIPSSASYEALKIAYTQLSIPRILSLVGLIATATLTGIGLSRTYLVSKFITIPLSIALIYLIFLL